MTADRFEKSYFHGLYPKLHDELSRIKGASLRYERAAEEQVYDLKDDFDESSLPTDEMTYSYHLFFFYPNDGPFRYKTKEEPDEANPAAEEEVVPGEGFIGCVVGVSLLAPFAVVALNNFHDYEDGSHSCPDLEIHAYDEGGKRLTAEEFFRSQVGEAGVRLLCSLCEQAAKVLTSHGITVLSEVEQRLKVPWLRAGKEILREERGHLTVKEALFFAEL